MEKMQAYFCYIKTLKPQLTPESNRLVIGYRSFHPNQMMFRKHLMSFCSLRKETSAAHVDIPRSLSLGTKQCVTHVYTLFLQPLIRRKQLGNSPNKWARRLNTLAKRTLAKRHLCLVKIAYELKRIGIRSPRHQTISPPRIELSVNFKKSH